MKEYGVDLKKQYDKLTKEKISLIGRIEKRRAFLIKNAPKGLIAKLPFMLMYVENDVEVMLNEIIYIEKLYAEQSSQLSMFDDQ